MSKSDLEKHYLDTNYIVYLDGHECNINIGHVIPTFIQKLLETDSKKSAVVITACNPKSQLLTFLENKSRNDKLRSKLNNYTVYKAIGQGSDPSWPAEESYFVIGITQNKAEQLAVEFEQYAFVMCESGKAVSLEFTELW